MEALVIFILAVCIAVDNMVSANMSAMKAGNQDNRNSLSLKIAVIFTVVNLVMLVLGALLGMLAMPPTAKGKLWVAFAFIFLLGLKILLEAIDKTPSFSIKEKDVNNKMFKTSMLLGANAFMLGLAVMVMGKSVFFAGVCIFFCTMIGSMIGFSFGKPDSKTIASKKAEAIAGIIVIIIAIRLIIYYSV